MYVYMYNSIKSSKFEVGNNSKQDNLNNQI